MPTPVSLFTPHILIYCLGESPGPSIVNSRYIAVVYNTIMHVKQQLRCKIVGQTLHSRTTPHSSPVRASYMVSLVSSSKKNDRCISKAHCVSDNSFTVYLKGSAVKARYIAFLIIRYIKEMTNLERDKAPSPQKPSLRVIYGMSFFNIIGIKYRVLNLIAA